MKAARALLVLAPALACAQPADSTPPPSPVPTPSPASSPSPSPSGPSEQATQDERRKTDQGAVELSGDCVVPPTQRREIEANHRGVDQEGSRHSSDRTWWVTAHEIPDLDGDGQLDFLSPTSAGGPCM